MKPVRMSKYKLVDKLKLNRTKHETDFVSAMEEYRKEVLKKLRALTKTMKACDDSELAGLDLYVTLTRPQQYLNEYDCALAMFENTLDDEIELNEREFRQYVLDEWSWKESFVGSTGLYNIK